jgi:isorenieratene synthase
MIRAEGRVRRTARGLGLLVGRLPKTPVPAGAPRGPDWLQAAPEWIDAALAHALAKNGGGWYVLDRRPAFAGSGPWSRTVSGRTLVVWRASDGRIVAAPDSCPHMGGSLAAGRVEAGRVICPWHGLTLDTRGFRDWRCHPTHDDGVLVWVRLPSPGEVPTERPILAARPEHGIAASISAEIRCEPEDVLANRLDPWHGAHFHPHSFSALEVLERSLEALRLRVVYRVAGPIGIEVDATFHCPDPRTIVMTIVDGDGAGSVVETHATPIAPGRTLLVESAIATSDRPGFGLVRRVPGLVRPLLENRAMKLWADDIGYAERRYALRNGRTSAAG